MSVRLALFAAALALSPACSDSAVDADAGLDASSILGDAAPAGGGTDGSTPAGDGGNTPGVTVELGTGEDGFEPITEGQVLPLTIGLQGGGRYQGYHIWAAIRTTGMSPTGVNIDLTLRTPAGEMLSHARYRLDLQPIGGDTAIAYALQARLDDCCRAENTEMIFRAEVRGSDGTNGTDERRIRGGAMCPANTGVGTDVCP